MEDRLLYSDESKLKDLTVGQLKDIITEVLNRGIFTRFEPEKRVYKYETGYYVPKYNPDYENPYIPKGPYCSENKGEIC